MDHNNDAESAPGLPDGVSGGEMTALQSTVDPGESAKSSDGPPRSPGDAPPLVGKLVSVEKSTGDYRGVVKVKYGGCPPNHQSYKITPVSDGPNENGRDFDALEGNISVLSDEPVPLFCPYCGETAIPEMTDSQVIICDLHGCVRTSTK